jgi:hypothetical protein
MHAVTVTIRNVPDEVRDELAARPSRDEFWEEIRARKAAAGTRLSAEDILADRDADPSVIVVPDATAAVAAPVDDGPVGRWAVEPLSAGPLVARHPLPTEVANVLRRRALAGVISLMGSRAKPMRPSDASTCG